MVQPTSAQNSFPLPSFPSTNSSVASTSSESTTTSSGSSGASWDLFVGNSLLSCHNSPFQRAYRLHERCKILFFDAVSYIGLIDFHFPGLIFHHQTETLFVRLLDLQWSVEEIAVICRTIRRFSNQEMHSAMDQAITLCKYTPFTQKILEALELLSELPTEKRHLCMSGLERISQPYWTYKKQKKILEFFLQMQPDDFKRDWKLVHSIMQATAMRDNSIPWREGEIIALFRQLAHIEPAQNDCVRRLIWLIQSHRSFNATTCQILTLFRRICFIEKNTVRPISGSEQRDDNGAHFALLFLILRLEKEKSSWSAVEMETFLGCITHFSEHLLHKLVKPLFKKLYATEEWEKEQTLSLAEALARLDDRHLMLAIPDILDNFERITFLAAMEGENALLEKLKNLFSQY